VVIDSLRATLVGCHKIARTHTCLASSLQMIAATVASTSNVGFNLRRLGWFPRRKSPGAYLQAES